MSRIEAAIEQAILTTISTGKTTSKEAAALHGVSESSVSNILRRHGIKPTIGRPPTCDLDHEVFDVITPESAYWMGFLFADGCITEYRGGAPQVILDLGEKDRAHVEKFRTFLKSTHKIITVQHKRGNIKELQVSERKSCTFRVRSTQLVTALQTRGMVKKGPDRAPVGELENSVDFWRGVVDGDGTVRVHIDKRGNGYKYPCLILCGHMPLLEKYQAFLIRQGVSTNIIDTISGIYQIRMLGAPALSIIRLLYANATVALDRKIEMARVILVNHNC